MIKIIKYVISPIEIFKLLYFLLLFLIISSYVLVQNIAILKIFIHKLICNLETKIHDFDLPYIICAFIILNETYEYNDSITKISLKYFEANIIEFASFLHSFKKNKRYYFVLKFIDMHPNLLHFISKKYQLKIKISKL